MGVCLKKRKRKEKRTTDESVESSDSPPPLKPSYVIKNSPLSVQDKHPLMFVFISDLHIKKLRATCKNIIEQQEPCLSSLL